MSRLLADVAGVLDAAFPLHLLVDRAGTVVRLGPLAGRVMCARRGQRLLSVLDVEQPKATGFMPEELLGKPIIARAKGAEALRLRGQLIPAGHELWALVCSPIVQDLDVLAACGLTLEDLPAHDPTPELLKAAKVQRAEQAAQRQGQKMETLGRLVGGITHDFNNLLVAILGHASHGLEESRDPVAREALQGVFDAAERAAALTARLLTFSSPSPGTNGPVDASREVRQVAGMLRRLLREEITLDVHIQVQPAWIPLDRTELEQILVNLAVNARDAMAGGGELTVTLDRRRPDEASAVAMGVPAGTHVCLSVRDSGSGIPAHVLDHIFEPFYTTKGAGKGTGLGLSTVFGLVKGVGGTVQVNSGVGRGTTFFLWFPEAEPPRRTVSGRHALGRVPASEGEVVLLVDDEPQIRRVVGRMLAKDGWQVRQATSVDNALERLPAVHDLALVITDQNMPGKTGVELVEALRDRGVTAPCIIMSGYSDDPRLFDGVRKGRFRLLSKPFSSEKLQRAVDRAIARGRLRRLSEAEMEPPTMPSWIGRSPV